MNDSNTIGYGDAVCVFTSSGIEFGVVTARHDHDDERGSRTLFDVRLRDGSYRTMDGEELEALYTEHLTVYYGILRRISEHPAILWATAESARMKKERLAAIMEGTKPDAKSPEFPAVEPANSKAAPDGQSTCGQHY